MPRLNLRTKIVLAMGLIALLVAGSITATDYHFRRQELLAEFQMSVRSVAGTCALAIRGEDVASIRGNADASAPAFVRVRTLLERVREVNGLAENEVYVLRPVSTSADPFETEFVCMLQRRTFVGDRYSIPAANRAPYRAAWEGMRPSATGIYMDPNGAFISGYAAVDDGAGKPVAVVEVDANVSRFLDRQHRALLTSLAIGGAAFLVAMIPGLLMATRMTQGLNRLTDGIRRFQKGEYQTRVVVRSRDEIQRMSEVFNEMIISLAEKLALLPYVSRFTTEAVRRSREDPNWLSGMEQSVVVLFADLRGFTRFSEERQASKVVQELNQLLGVQAEVVISSGGDVDKFVGDRVMAVFLDGDESTPGLRQSASQTAVTCARELLAKVCELTTRTGWSLSLGVGIHRGRAVVGSIGSSARRDFTAIGHTVNLASRLCDQASPWQVMVTQEVYDALPATEQAQFVANPPLRVKNVSRVVTTYAYRLAVSSELEAATMPASPAAE